MDKRTDITGCYLKETRSLVNELKNNPQNFARILRTLSMTKDNSRILGYIPVYKLYKALEDVYKALCDEKISFNETNSSI